MGKKKETISLIDTFSEFNELKNIDKATLISVLEEAFRNVISKATGTDENYDIIINPDRGDLEIWRNRGPRTMNWKIPTCKSPYLKH